MRKQNLNVGTEVEPSSRKKQQGINGESFREDLASDPVDQACSIFA